jgi:heme/copper-type cytochrome/quinol oxidase subunit 2
MVPLIAIDYVLHEAFLTDGYINNDIVGNIVAYDLTGFQAFWYGVFGILAIAIVAVRDYRQRKASPYHFKGNERLASVCAGIIIAALALVVPWLQPNGYQIPLGWIIIFVTLLTLREALRTQSKSD